MIVGLRMQIADSVHLRMVSKGKDDLRIWSHTADRLSNPYCCHSTRSIYRTSIYQTITCWSYKWLAGWKGLSREAEGSIKAQLLKNESEIKLASRNYWNCRGCALYLSSVRSLCAGMKLQIREISKSQGLCVFCLKAAVKTALHASQWWRWQLLSFIEITVDAFFLINHVWLTMKTPVGDFRL